MAKRIIQGFKFQTFSEKQVKVLTWWQTQSGVSEADGIIADGAIRSGKTVSMALSFVIWAMETFNGHQFGLCGKTIGSFRRNVLKPLKRMLPGRGYKVIEHRADNYIEIRKGDTVNEFYIFGGKDERSQDLIQGITLAGVLFDEVALMPRSFVEQATGRCSVPGSKFWFNCNPANPAHWFKKEWIDRVEEKNLLYLHFTMDDNLSLTEKTKERYRNYYRGVFFKRYILGLWAAADGAVYPRFAENPEEFVLYRAPQIQSATIGVDFGGGTSGHAFQCVGYTARMQKLVVLEEYYNKDALDPARLERAFIDFVKLCQSKYPVFECYCDSAEKTLINGLINAAARERVYINIMPAAKKSINERIRCACWLMGARRWFVMAHCTKTIEAYQAAVYDSKKPTEDVRLDDGTTNIDTIDATEYCYERDIDTLMSMGDY